jgi:hypothetical protein
LVFQRVCWFVLIPCGRPAESFRIELPIWRESDF